MATSATGITRRDAMRARMAAVTGESPRRVVTCTRSVMRTLGLVAGAMLATFCVAGMAMAEGDPPFEGRWTALNESLKPGHALRASAPLTLDLSPCGDSWCGVEVTTAGSCGRTMLRTRSQRPEDRKTVV